MPAPSVVRAQVVDIQSDTPRDSDVFFVDTNAWYWFAYPRAGMIMNPADQGRAAPYLSYLNAALNAQAALCRTGLTLNELAASIEGAERAIQKIARSHSKTFRYDRRQRRAVVSQVRATWQLVVSASHHLDMNVDHVATRQALARLYLYPLDGTDAMVVGTLLQQSVNQILTDDADFAAVPGLQLFTASQDVLAAALAQGQTGKR